MSVCDCAAVILVELCLSALCIFGKETQEVVNFTVSARSAFLALFIGFVLHLYFGVSSHSVVLIVF